jgi:hypothetical protein
LLSLRHVLAKALGYVQGFEEVTEKDALREMSFSKRKTTNQ